MRTGLTVWFTGLSGAGKTTIAEAVLRELHSRGARAELLDGDLIRRQLSKGLGYSKADRDENIRRIGFVAALLTRHQVITLVAAISPYREAREQVRRDIGSFLEIFVDAPLAVCMERDPKGLYAKASAGEISGLTGVDDPYEPPLAPDVICRTAEESPEQSARKVLAAVARKLEWLPAQPGGDL